MLRSSKTLLFLFIGCVIAAALFYWLGLADSGLKHLMHHEGLEGDKLKEHDIHVGLYQAISIYLGIAFTFMSAVSLPLFLLTACKYDKEPEGSHLAHSHH